jgi:hypothetical protein
MNKKLFISFLFICAFTVLPMISANAQTTLTGKYIYLLPVNVADYKVIYTVSYDLRSGGKLFYKSECAELDDVTEKTGYWSWGKKRRLLTAVTFATKENLSKVTLVFKLKGKNLQVISVLPSYVGKIGKTFMKVKN